MLLITAISKPQRLDKYLPDNLVGKIYFADHHMYTKEELQELMKNHHATSILTTEKDMVKMQKFNLPLSILHLEVTINKQIKDQINEYLVNFR